MWWEKTKTILKVTWVRYAAFALIALAVAAVILRVFFKREDPKKVAPVVLTGLDKATQDYEEAVTQAVVELAKARGSEEAVHAQIKTISEMPSASVRRRRLISLYKSL